MCKGFRNKKIANIIVGIFLLCLIHYQLLSAIEFPSPMTNPDVSNSEQTPSLQPDIYNANNTLSHIDLSTNRTSMAPEDINYIKIIDSLSAAAKLNKPQELTLLTMSLIVFAAGAAIEGAKYTLGHFIFGDPWDWYDFTAALISGGLTYLVWFLALVFGWAIIADTLGTANDVGLAEALRPVISGWLRGAVSGITDAWDALFGNTKTTIEGDEDGWESAIGSTLIDLHNASSGQYDLPSFDSRWADFTEETVQGYGMVVSGLGVEYNEYYGASWRFLYPGTSHMTFSFDFTDAPDNGLLILTHLTSADAGCPGGGYSPIDIYLNGYLLADNYDVAENNDGSHGYETDQWDISGLLLSNNTLTIELEDDPWACTHYWIQNLCILPGSQSGDIIPPAVVGYNYTASIATNIYVEFSEYMDQSTLNGSNIDVVGSTSGIHSCGFSFDPGTYILTINPYSDFVYDEIVTVNLGTGISDLAGNFLDSPYLFQFIVGQEPGSEPTTINLSVSVNPSTIEPGESFVVSGTAQYNTGYAVPAGTAAIAISGNVWTAAISNGSYSRSINYYFAPGDYTVNVTAYDGLGRTGFASNTLHVEGYDSSPYWDLDFIRTCDFVEEDSDGDIYTAGCGDLFAPDFNAALWGAMRITDVYTPVRPRIQLLDPTGTAMFDTILNWAGPMDGSWAYAWWYWGYSSVPKFSNSGRYTYRWHLQHYGDSWQFVGAKDLTYRYEMEEHVMAHGVNMSTYQPILPSNNFTPSDASAYTWMHLHNLCENIGVRWQWINPNGALEAEWIINPISDGHVGDPFNLPYGEYYIWGNMDIAGYSPSYKCGDWTVKVYLTNAWGNWEHKYTDYFRIEESTPPSVTISRQPLEPIETQRVSISVSASDNNHLKRVLLYWNDGALNSVEMANNINSGSYNGSVQIGPFANGQSVTYWAEVWDESDNEIESVHQSFIVQPELVSMPSRPDGPVYLVKDSLGQYITGGSTSNLGNPVQYQFGWGDETYSSWSGGSAIKSWPADGTYLTKAHARSQTNTERISDWSTSLPVIVDTYGPIVIIETNEGNNYIVGAQLISICGQSSDREPSSGLAYTNICTGSPNVGNAHSWEFNIILDEGDNQLIVNSYDNSGNNGSDTIIVTCNPDWIGPGNNVAIQITDNIVIVFDSISVGGVVNLSIETEGPPPPQGFNIIPVTQPVYYDIGTTVQYVDSIGICITYDEGQITNSEESMRLYHYNDEIWTDITNEGMPNVDINEICGSTALLSPFVLVCPTLCGDANRDGVVNVGDAVFIIDFVFRGGAYPDPYCSGDSNRDTLVNIGDVVYIINYVFRGGPEPPENCCY